MNNKIVSQLDENGFFVCEAIADESPLEPGVFLMPAGCIDKAPPKTIEPGKRYRQWGTSWRGEDMPVEVVEQEEAPELSETEKRILDIAGALNEIDRQSIRPARVIAVALAAGSEAPALEVSKIEYLEREAERLRSELEALGAGND